MGCNYHNQQREEIDRAWKAAKYTTGEGTLERQALDAEIQRCGECAK
jgi:hypothetical protein